MTDYPPNMTWADRYRYAGEDWADKEEAASLLENLRTSVLSQKCAELGGNIPVNRAEQIVKMSEDWVEYNKKMVAARKAANIARIELESLKMQFNDVQSK